MIAKSRPHAICMASKQGLWLSALNRDHRKTSFCKALSHDPNSLLSNTEVSRTSILDDDKLAILSRLRRGKYSVTI